MPAKLSGKHVLMVIAPEQFRDEELLEPKKIFTEAGARVSIAACNKGEAKGMLGASVNAELLISELNPEDYDACVVVGGMGSPEFLWNDARLHSVLKALYESNKVVAAICLSGAVLAKAGLLDDKKATVWPMPESLAALKEGGAHYLKEPVVRDGLIVTADGPDAASKFGQTVLEAIVSSSIPSPA